MKIHYLSLQMSINFIIQKKKKNNTILLFISMLHEGKIQAKYLNTYTVLLSILKARMFKTKYISVIFKDDIINLKVSKF